MNLKFKIEIGDAKFKMKNLIWKIEIENENGGYWECTYCGARYNLPENSKPKTKFCMKCKGEWEELK